MRKQRVDMLEAMNVIVAERMSYVDEFIESVQLKDECRKHIFPVYTPSPKYEPLQLMKVSGTFLFLFVFLCLSLCVFLAEIISIRWTKNDTISDISDEIEYYHLHIHYDNRLSTEAQQIITEKYLKLLSAIENDVAQRCQLG